MCPLVPSGLLTFTRTQRGTLSLREVKHRQAVLPVHTDNRDKTNTVKGQAKYWAIAAINTRSTSRTWDHSSYSNLPLTLVAHQLWVVSPCEATVSLASLLTSASKAAQLGRATPAPFVAPTSKPKSAVSPPARAQVTWRGRKIDQRISAQRSHDS